MFPYVTRVAQAMRSFFRARKRWGPRAARIAVLHCEHVSTLAPLFGDERYEVVHLDGEAIYLDPLILFATLRRGIRTRNLRLGYALAVLERIKPAIVVTYIDNSAIFQMAAKRFRAARFLAIQNGARLLDRDHPVGRSPRIHFREFACHGRHEVDQFTRHGADVETYYPIGSLTDSYYRAGRVRGAAAAKEFDLCLPSQLKAGVRLIHSERLDGFDVLTQHVRRFCESHKMTLCVPLRKHPDTDPAGYEWEREFFESRLGTLAQLFSNVPGAHTTYGLVDRSRVSLGMHSTVLREGFGRGSRILSCNYTGNPTYTFPIPGPWSLTDPAYDAFEEKLLWLLGASEEQYADVCGDAPSYLISYDTQIPTHVFLRNLIAEAVSGWTPAATGHRE